jgi:predicted amidohydrolase YtcJ
VTSLVLSGARLHGRDAASDVVIRDGVIADVAPAGALRAGRGEVLEVVDAGGRFVGPGMWDHHVHLRQVALRRRRVDLAAATSAADVLAAVRVALDARPAAADGVLVGYGFRDATWREAPSRAALDAVAGDRPVVLVSADLHCGWLSSAAARRAGVTIDATGVLREDAWMAVLRDVETAADLSPAIFAEAAAAAARRGVVGVVDFENADNVTDWPERVAAGVDTQRVVASIWPDRLEEAVARGLRTGDPLDPAGLVTVGPLKVIVDGSLNTRTALCLDPYPEPDPHGSPAAGVAVVPVPELRRLLRTAGANGIGAAVHAIGDRANREVLDVFEELGMRGSIEHAQFVADDDFARFGRLGLVAGIQPEHAMDDRDAAERHWPGRTGRAFAYRSLLDGGARLRLGSDAPVAPLDPWLALAAATTRSRDGRPAWHPEQRIPVDVALAGSVGSRVAPGEPADLVVVEVDPLRATGEQLRTMPVAGTLLGGRWTHRAL